jgi:hypothetical protein
MIMHPIINNNGTSREELIQMRLAAKRALHAAMKSLQELSPHGRDYLGNNEAWKADRAIHVARFTALDAMANDLMEEAVSIMESVTD